MLSLSIVKKNQMFAIFFYFGFLKKTFAQVPVIFERKIKLDIERKTRELS